MRIYSYIEFEKWSKAEKIKDTQLIQAITEVNHGLFDANLGGGLYKKRIAKKGIGKRGGYRTLIAFKKDDTAFFVYGFSKKEKENITINEKLIYKKLAGDLLNASEKQILTLLYNGKLKEAL